MGILLTGALHEDGVADFFDSLGGKDYTTRQKILKDSRLGTYGVLALTIVFLLKILTNFRIRVFAGISLWPNRMLKPWEVFNFNFGQLL